MPTEKRLSSTRLYPHGRRGPHACRYTRRPYGYKLLQCTDTNFFNVESGSQVDIGEIDDRITCPLRTADDRLWRAGMTHGEIVNIGGISDAFSGACDRPGFSTWRKSVF